MLLRESAVELGPGSVLAGRFQIRRVLGKGATGVVLEADDRVSRSLVALKVFKAEIAADDRWQEILGSELRHARQLMHPNVCRVFDAGEADGYRFLSMEYASGGSLRQRLKEAGPDRAFEERVADARAVVDGLAAIHAAGLIHRDVKPDNVLVMEDGRLVLTDFGLAVAPGQTTFVSGYSGAVGTPSYMAPEVAMGGDASMASDVFSLGVILHEIFFGRRPEWETTRRGRFLRSPVDRHSSRRLRLMARLCSECLEELAPRRPQSAIEAGRRLERAALGSYRSVLGIFRAGKWSIVTALVTSATAGVSVFFSTRPSDGTRRLELAGTPVNLGQKGEVVAPLPSRLQCLWATPDGKDLRAVWGSPPRAFKIDVSSGRATPWNVLPETYQSSNCPVPSPDGRRLAFAVGAKARQIMLSPNPDGSGARKLADGFSPQWLPNGQELIYFFDYRRLAVISPGGVPSLVPESGTADELLANAGVSPAGDRIALVYGNAGLDGALIAIHALPSLQVTEKFRIPARVYSAVFSVSGNSLFLRAQVMGGNEILVLSSDGSLVRKVSLPGSDIQNQEAGARGLWLETETRSASLFTGMREGTKERETAVAQDFRGMSASPAGYVAIEEILRDGRGVIGLLDIKNGTYARATQGPRDIGPLFNPQGSSFAYVDWPRDRIYLCPVSAPSHCRVVVEGQRAWFLAGFSPSGERLAYSSLVAARLRLNVVSLADARIVDLGQGFAQLCPVRWSSEETLWAFHPSESPQWIELSPGRGTTTGRAEPVSGLGADGCPLGAESGLVPPVRISRSREARLWHLTMDAD
jgi:serine/threonine protein kinase